MQQGALLGLIVFAVGLWTRTRDVGGDDTVYAMAVENWLRGRGLAAEFFDTHHLLYNPIVGGVTWLVRLLVPEILVLDAGAAVSSLFAALTAGGLVFLLRRRGSGAWTSGLAAAAVVTCGAMWSMGTRMEVYTMAAAAVVLWLGVCSRSPPRPMLVGAALAWAILSHVALVVLVAPTAWRLRRDPLRAALAVSSGLALPLLALIVVFTLDRGVWSPAEWPGMILPAEAVGYVSPGDAGLAPRALYSLLLWNWYHGVPVLVPAAARVMDVLGVTAVALATGLLAAGAWTTLRDNDPLGRLSLLSLIAFVPLWLFWDAGNPEHAVAAAPLFGVLMAHGTRRFPRETGKVALGTLVGLLLIVNGLAGAALQRRPENGRLWVTAAFVTERVAPRGVILAVGTDPRVRLGLGYLSGRSVVDLTLSVRSARLNGGSAVDGLEYWIRRARQAPELWALDEVYEITGEDWVADLGIPPQEWRAAVARLNRGRAFVLEADGAVVREPFRLHRVRWAQAVLEPLDEPGDP